MTNHLMTRWGNQLDQQNPLPEYPRPQMRRPEWQCLNGRWDYAVTAKDAPTPGSWSGKIVVPFCIESRLSGVEKALRPDERLWYHRQINIPPEWQGKRVLLHFGAVDWQTTLYLNGQVVGSHSGGYTPFSFEITAQLTDGINELSVSVWDPTSKHWQEKGKQTLKPGGIMYTACSGIWQTVWLEAVPQSYITDIRMTPDMRGIDLSVNVNGSESQIQATVLDADKQVAEATFKAGETVRIEIPEPKLWSPETPFLYDLKIKLGDEDAIESYCGLRSFGMTKDDQGHPRLTLNNEPIFHCGMLDQGYWPDGIYTPASDEALEYDVIKTKEMGFNMLRKHIKVEPARWYYHCDRLGVIVWQDMVCAGYQENPYLAAIPWIASVTFNFTIDDTRMLWRFGSHKPESRENFRKQLKAMIDALYNVPSIAMWVPFNEAWGQFHSEEIAEWVREYDPSRLIDHASGWHDQGAGDLISIHTYSAKFKTAAPDGRRAYAITEFGGLHVDCPGHYWQEGKTFGYRKFKNLEKFKAAYTRLFREQIQPKIKEGLSAIVYTQVSDVEGETNGLMTYDRKKTKLDETFFKDLNDGLYKEFKK